MAQLVIKGHKTRSHEIIEILEMLGGRNQAHLKGIDNNLGYYICTDGYIDTLIAVSSKSYKFFTLEEFLEKFPYKVGDKVNSPCKGCIKTITSMEWDKYLNTVTYKLDNRIYTNIDQLKVNNKLPPYRETIMEENIIDTIKESDDKYRIKVNYQFDIEVDEGEYYAVRRKPQYPKTYEECCKILNIPSNGNIAYVGNWVYGGEYLEKHLDRLRNFQKLLICRDVYWKIAGEQMGLGKPWEPDDCQIVYSIGRDSNRISLCNDMFGGYFILEFPTKEMRDVFYENFRELIELCKELL